MINAAIRTAGEAAEQSVRFKIFSLSRKGIRHRDAAQRGRSEILLMHRNHGTHRHLIRRHRHPTWHGHCDQTKRGYKPCTRWHWHFWWRHPNHHA